MSSSNSMPNSVHSVTKNPNPPPSLNTHPSTLNSSLPVIDLTQRPPRSHRIRLGGYVMLPRILDKGRALNAGKLGEYRYGAKL